MSSKDEREPISEASNTLDTSKPEITEPTENSMSDKPNYQNYKNTIYKSEGVTLILSIILGLIGFNGTGHIYLGKVRRGIVLLVGSLAMFVMMFGVWVITDVLLSAELVLTVFGVFTICYIVVFIYQIINSRKLCKEYNKAVYETGIAPW